MIVTLMCANLIIRKIYKDGSPSVKVALSQHYNGSERPCKRFLRVRIYTVGRTKYILYVLAYSVYGMIRAMIDQGFSETPEQIGMMFAEHNSI